MLKDILNREIVVGDILAWSGAGSGISIDVVTKILPKTVRVGYGSSVHPGSAMVVTDQMQISDGAEKAATLIKQFKDQFDYAKPPTRMVATKFQYALMFMGKPSTHEVFLHVGKLQSNTKQENSSNYNKLVKKLNADGFVLCSDYYRNQSVADPVLVNTKYQVAEGYYHNHQMLLRDIKALGMEAHVDQDIPLHVLKSSFSDVLDLTKLDITKLFK